jgi:hypothetical protein
MRKTGDSFHHEYLPVSFDPHASALHHNICCLGLWWEQSLGPWDMSRVLWYRSHPDETTARLKWCAEHNRGNSECGAAMHACNDILKTEPHGTCQSPMAH